MFCPKCATQNVDGASFCRSCGANISLVPQALTGQLAQTPREEVVVDDCIGRRGKVLTLDHAFRNIFMGVAFLIIAIAISRTIGGGWWFWMLIPAFSMMGIGLAQFMRIKEREKRITMAASRVPQPPQVTTRRTDELLPPPPTSVTEGTTRHLGVEAPTRHLEPK